MPEYNFSLDAREHLDHPADAEILRDEHAVSSCIGGSEHDVFFLNGVVHAQDRLWQMHSARASPPAPLHVCP